MKNMNTSRFLMALGLALGSAAASQATIIGFGQIGGNNTNIENLPSPHVNPFASRAAAAGSGFVVTNGATPNIALTWSNDWDVHTSTQFAPLENKTVGGGDWDNEGNVPRVGQLDVGSQNIVFASDPGYSLVLNSFDFGHTAETAGTTVWNLTLADASSSVVWSQAVTFVNGAVETIAPAFTGTPGGTYTLAFSRTSETYNSNGRHGIDNLSFNQVAVPEPGAIAMLSLAGMAFVSRRRK